MSSLKAKEKIKTKSVTCSFFFQFASYFTKARPPIVSLAHFVQADYVFLCLVILSFKGTNSSSRIESLGKTQQPQRDIMISQSKLEKKRFYGKALIKDLTNSILVLLYKTYQQREMGKLNKVLIKEPYEE